jgi:hypothetical protein
VAESWNGIANVGGSLSFESSEKKICSEPCAIYGEKIHLELYANGMLLGINIIKKKRKKL